MRFMLILATAALAAATAFAHDSDVGSIHIDHPWSRETPKGEIGRAHV